MREHESAGKSSQKSHRVLNIHRRPLVMRCARSFSICPNGVSFTFKARPQTWRLYSKLSVGVQHRLIPDPSRHLNGAVRSKKAGGPSTWSRPSFGRVDLLRRPVRLNAICYPCVGGRRPRSGCRPHGSRSSGSSSAQPDSHPVPAARQLRSHPRQPSLRSPAR